MKFPIIFVFLTMAGMVCAQIPPPEKAAETAKQAPARVRFKGKVGAPTTTTITATRSGGQSAIKLVIIAPGHEGVSRNARPRLWWYQSEAIDPKNLEFTLSRMDGIPKVVIRRMNKEKILKGFNVFDFNKEGVSLENGAIYQWTIRLARENSAPQVYCRMKAEIKEPAGEPLDITALAESGNWYELFDAVATRAMEPDGSAMVESRTGLLEQIGLADAVK